MYFIMCVTAFSIFNFLSIIIALFIYCLAGWDDGTVATCSESSPQCCQQMATLNKTNLIVNYLPQSLTDDEFRQLFEKFGQVTGSKVVRDRATGYSYGFGFIDYATEAEAEHAVHALNGSQLQHKRIKVAFSRQGDNIKGANLYIRNLPKAATAGDVEQAFAPYGDIVQTRVLTDQTTGLSKGVGFVLFSTREEAELARQHTDGKPLPGTIQPVLNVKFAEDNKNKMLASLNSFAATANMGYPQATPTAAGNFPVGGVSGFNVAGGGPMRNQTRMRYNPMGFGGGASGGFSSGGGNPGSSGGGVGVGDKGHVLFVYNIGTETDEYALWQLFCPYGSVQRVNVIRDQAKKTGKGYGFVTMNNYDEAVWAIQNLNGYTFSGTKPLQVSFKS